MNFASPKRPRREENIIPMINVVFLLLIFFLMSAQITPPAPVDVALPTADGTTPENQNGVAYLDRDSQFWFEGEAGDAAFAKLQGWDQPLHLQADKSVPALSLRKLLGRLAAAGVTDVHLITEASQ